MMELPRILRDVGGTPDASREGPLQLQMGGVPYYVAVASMLLCRTRRARAEPALYRVLKYWPTPSELSRSDTVGLQKTIRSCGFHLNRSRQLQRFAVGWMGDWWDDMRELPGVGVYVADAIGLFCFGCKELGSKDSVLHKYAAENELVRVARRSDGLWGAYRGSELVSGSLHEDPQHAVNIKFTLEGWNGAVSR